MASTVEPAPSTPPPWWRQPAHVVAALLVLAYVVAVARLRFENAFDPYVAETDWKQAIWHYWRYSAALLARDLRFHVVTAGGYARSFGPLLVLVFLAACLDGTSTRGSFGGGVGADP